jgi:ribosomal protein S18 acetylase RimI-like enzyme
MTEAEQGERAGPLSGQRDGRSRGGGPARIRGFREADLDALYRICLETGDAGDDATALYRDPNILGHIYAGPYGRYEPSLAFVAEDDSGVAGYCLGALDSRAFARRLEQEWWPRLRDQYPDPDPARQADWTPDEWAACQIHHPRHLDPDLLSDYPSHLHIDLLPRLQGGGYGRLLMAAELEALRNFRSPGLQLHVSRRNQRAIGFYRHLGFAELRTDAVMHTFGMRL